MKRLASIDIGTQTIRILIADCNDNGEIKPVYRDRQIIRLGADMNSNLHLAEKNIRNAINCISSFKNIADKYGVEKIFAASTACVREASNSNDFIESVYNNTAITPAVLSGEQEALLTLKGVQSVTSHSNYLLVIDIGGGSTEFILTKNNKIIISESIKLGVVSLSERFLHNDPPLPEELSLINSEISKILLSGSKSINASVNKNSVPGLIGSAGTITTLAAMDMKMNVYDPDIINGHVLKIKTIESLFEQLIKIPSTERNCFNGLEKGREIVIIPGISILTSIMNLIGSEKLTVSDSGLLEGILLDKI
jgi:exopolyphosphatase/guanosine-5'-triphosphate,3'-diphosphate pyrophosphatase